MTNKIVAIQGNYLPKLNPLTDTSILANEIQKKNYKIFYFEPRNLSLINSLICLWFVGELNYNKKKF